MLALNSAPNAALLPTLLPLAVFVLALPVVVYLIQDLYRPDRRVSGGDKSVWLLVILFGSVVGCLAYVLYGREA